MSMHQVDGVLLMQRFNLGQRRGERIYRIVGLDYPHSLLT